MAELQALEPGALDYTVVESGVGDGRKKIVRIIYAKCTAWQQVATLLKALREQQDSQFDTILIQGVLDANTSIYSFNNGQLRFDRNVRLGDAVTNRYQIETGNGFDSEAVRIVLTAS
jgi:coenzyme F420-reducing hydrogenase delta subunit